MRDIDVSLREDCNKLTVSVREAMVVFNLVISFE